MNRRRLVLRLRWVAALLLWVHVILTFPPLLLVAPSDAGTAGGPSGEDLRSTRLLRQAGQQITICHFPPGNADPQVITVGTKAAAAHIKNHERDGIIGEDYDETCQPLPSAAIANFSLSASGVVVTISWVATTEIGVARYEIDRKPQGNIAYDQSVIIISPAGEGTQYSLEDFPPASGNYFYRLRVVFPDGTTKILAEELIGI